MTAVLPLSSGVGRRVFILSFIILFVVSLHFIFTSFYGGSPPPYNALKHITTGSSSSSSASPEEECEPYTRPGHLYLNPFGDHLATYFQSFDPKCQSASPTWLTQVRKANDDRSIQIPALQNKELLIVGDSVDRIVVIALCQFMGATVNTHPMHAFNETIDEQTASGGHPRSCHISHLNLTIANYFLYGFDETNMFPDNSAYTPPGNYTERLAMLERAVKTLPSGGEPDLVFTNICFWELSRFSRWNEWAGRIDPIDVDRDFLEDYSRSLIDYIHKLRDIIGPKPRLRWRETHTPAVYDANFVLDEGIMKGERRARFSAPKVHMVNSMAERVLENFPDIKIWPIGKFVRAWPSRMWIKDDLHPHDGPAATIWGEGLLEYLARTPRVR